jgi:hypothetical protein
MIFQKKKPKIDPKIRFQNRQFNQKLQEARTFKRTVRQVPDGSMEKFLAKIGLGSRWMQILVALVVLGVVYVIYAPNFLTVQAIKVEGLPDDQRKLVESAIEESLNNPPFYNPQHNLFFMSKVRVTQAAMSVAGIDAVEKISKNFPQKTLTLQVKPKHERFLVRSNEQVFDVYNDGTLKGVAGLNRDAWLGVQNPGMAKVDLGGTVPQQESRQFFTPETVQYIIVVQEKLKGIVGSPLAYFSVRIPQLKEQQDLIDAAEEQQRKLREEVEAEHDANTNADSEEEDKEESGKQEEEPPVETQAPSTLPKIDISLPIRADELDLIFNKGTNQQRTFKVIVDTKENPDQLVQRLNLLLSQTAPDRYNNLSYIDMRIPSRAFVCLLNSPCTR